MTRIERRVLTNSAVTGAIVTCAVLLAWTLGWLQVTENWLYDLRARHFHVRNKPPTDKLVHIDIDDKALDLIGYWPWPRAKLAEMIDEMHLAGASAIGLDILFPERQPPEVEVSTAADGSLTPAKLVDNDAVFAAAVARAGNVILPASVTLDAVQQTVAYRATVELLLGDLSLSERAIVDRLGTNGFDDLATKVSEFILAARRDAAFQRIDRALRAEPKVTLDVLLPRLLPHGDSADVHSPLSRIVRSEYDHAQSLHALERFATSFSGTRPSLASAAIALPPVPPLAYAAATSGFVDYRPSRDGVLRQVPLLLDVNGRGFPQMGLSLAMVSMGLKPNDLRVTANGIELPRPDGTVLSIPTRTVYSDPLHRSIPQTLDIPWFGGARWEFMYDWPEHRKVTQHIPIADVWAPYDTRQRIRRNNREADEALRAVRHFLSLPMTVPAADERLDDPDARAATIDATLADASDMLDSFTSLRVEDLPHNDQVFYASGNALRRIRSENNRLKEQLVAQRAYLAQRLNGRAALVGWTATGRMDVTPTSLHAVCPGVITHGVIFNAIMTDTFWRTPSMAMTIIIVVGTSITFGVLTTLFVAKLPAIWAALATAMPLAAYVLVNGLFFFGSNGLIVSLAVPLLTVAAVWAGCSIVRIAVETNERGRITRHFQAYVDPTLVNYVNERPDEVRLQGETREMTVCFSDLAGFTTLSEALGERTVPLLNEYLGVMVPIIRGGCGYVNKFLGDGIMFFFGAPVPNPNHAIDAVTVALRMQAAMKPFNDALVARGLPTLAMRIGVSTGTMVVGDAGSADASDYTVLGDTVNLGARLESANKMTGTSVLISERTAELLDDRFLIRPIGALQVAGKTQGVMAFEACGFATDATDHQRSLCERTTLAVKHYRQKAFAEALQAIDEIDAVHGTNKLTGLYRALCIAHLANPPADPFDGKIVFTEK